LTFKHPVVRIIKNKECVMKKSLPFLLLCLVLILMNQCGKRKNPLEPEFVTLMSPEDGEVLTVTVPSFSWNGVSYAYLYQIQVDDRNTFYTPIVDDSTATATVYNCPVSLSDRQYWWRVRVRQEYSGWEVWSEINGFSVAVGTPVPLAPVNDTIDVSPPVFSWSEIDSALKYRLQVDDNNTFVTPVWDDSNITSASAVPDSAFLDGPYWWRVRVKTQDDEWSSWSSVAGFTLDASPFKIVASYQTMGYARDVVIRNDTAFVAQGEGGLAIIDLTDEEHPMLIGESDARGNAVGIALSDSFARLAVGKNGVSTVLISDPQNPVWQSLAAAGDDNAADLIYMTPPGDTAYIYVAENDEGMWILQVVPGYEWIPLPFWPFNVPGYESGLFLAYPYLFIGCGELGLSIVDISKVTEPEIVGHCDTKGYATGVFVQDTLAFVADGTEGIQVVNVADVTAPAIIGNFPAQDDAKAVFARGDTVFFADENNGFVVIDVSDPTLPGYLGGKVTQNAETVWIEDDYAVVVDRYDGILIVKW
jgi:hypothetical protein